MNSYLGEKVNSPCMEAREGISTGVTVIGAEAPSNYHVAPRTENPGQGSAPPALTASPVSVGLTGIMTEKKKRGRPRKYGPDGAVVRALSPTPISSSMPPAGEFSSGKRGRGRGGSYESKLQKKLGLDNFGKDPFGLILLPNCNVLNESSMSLLV